MAKGSNVLRLSPAAQAARRRYTKAQRAQMQRTDPAYRERARENQRRFFEALAEQYAQEDAAANSGEAARDG